MAVRPDITTKKPRAIMGPATGKKFSKENQPSPASKKKGWEEVRKQKHLTRGLINELIGKDGTPKASFNAYIKALVSLAKEGNSKAIETVNKALEDTVITVEPPGQNGNEGYKITLNIT